MSKKSRLRDYQSNLTKWGLKENPFRPTPPEDPQELEKIFYGRDEALDLAIPALYEGRNILVRGPWGIGKTAFILNLLYQLQQEVADLEEKMLVLYLSSIPGNSPEEFYRALLLGVADSLKEDIKEAKDIANTFLGFSIQPGKITKQGNVKLGVVSFGIKQESPTRQNVPTAKAEPYPLLIRLLNKGEERYSRIVIAIDDLDKKEPRIVQNILEGSLDLFRMGKYRGFVVTGRSFTDVQEATLKALGIFAEDIQLPTMSQEDLRQIAINYLNCARESQGNDSYPFTEEVINQITDYAQGFPRQLNTICQKVLDRAARGEYDKIDETAFSAIWPTLEQEFTHSLDPQARQLLYIASQAGGISENISDEDLDKLDVLTYLQLLSKLKSMEEQGMFIRQEDEEGDRFLPSKLFQPKFLPESE